VRIHRAVVVVVDRIPKAGTREGDSRMMIKLGSGRQFRLNEVVLNLKDHLRLRGDLKLEEEYRLGEEEELGE
jgi:hypothetical protein